MNSSVGVTSESGFDYEESSEEEEENSEGAYLFALGVLVAATAGFTYFYLK